MVRLCIVLLVLLLDIASVGKTWAQPPPAPSRPVLGAGENSRKFQYSDIEQDENGCMLFSAFGDLERFDGSSFKQIDVLGKFNMPIYLHKDQQGRVWCQDFQNGLAYLDGDKVTPYPYNELITDLMYRGKVGSMDMDEDGTLHLGIKGKGYFTVDSNGVLKHIYAPKEWMNGVVRIELSSGIVVSFKKYNAERLKDSLHLHILDNSFNQVLCAGVALPKKLSSDILHNRRTTFTIKTHKGDYLLSTGYNALYRISQNSVVDTFRLNHTILEIFEDSRNGIWLSGHRGRVYHYPYGNFELENQKKYFDSPETSTLAVVRCEDRDGGIWVNRGKAGIFQIPGPHQSLYNTTSGHLIANWTLSSEHIGDKIAVGTRNGGVTLIDRQGHQPAGSISLSHFKDTIHGTALHYSKNIKRLWIGGDSQFGYFDMSDPEKVISHRPYPIVGSCKAITKDSMTENICIIAANSFAIVKDSQIVFRSDTFKRRIFDGCFGKDGSIWIIGEFGVKNMIFQENGTQLLEQRDISETIFSAVGTAHGKTWLIPTSSGLYVTNSDSFSKVQFPTEFSPNIVNVFFDENHLWANSKNGFFKINNPTDRESSFQITVFATPVDGLGFKHVYRTPIKNDAVYLLTDKGLLYQDLTVLSPNYKSPVTMATEIRINNIDTALFESYDLTFNQNNIRVAFSAPQIALNSWSSYRYRLTENEHWIDIEDRRINFLSFSHLPPAQYELEVQARTPDFPWGPSEKVLFNIAPPYWQTWWFRSLIAGLIIVLIWMLATYRARMRQRQTQLELDSHIANQKALRSQINPHFVFNVISGVQYLVNKSPSKASQLLGHFASLIRKALDHSFVQWISLESELEQLEQYVQLEQLRMDNSFDYDIQIQGFKTPGKVAIPPALIQPYVENAIWHGLKGKEEKGRLKLVFKSIGSDLNITITDNGEGRQQHEQPRKNGHKSYGMLISAQRIKLLNDEKGNNAQVTIDDLLNEKQEPIGTRVSITLKLRQLNEDINN